MPKKLICPHCKVDLSLSDHKLDCPKRSRQYKRDFARCSCCGQPMTQPQGYGGTGLCGMDTGGGTPPPGPCATGEASTLEDFGESW